MGYILPDFIPFEEVLFERIGYIREVLKHRSGYKYAPDEQELRNELCDVTKQYSELINRKEK